MIVQLFAVLGKKWYVCLTLYVHLLTSRDCCFSSCGRDFYLATTYATYAQTHLNFVRLEYTLYGLYVLSEHHVRAVLSGRFCMFLYVSFVCPNVQNAWSKRSMARPCKLFLYDFHQKPQIYEVNFTIFTWISYYLLRFVYILYVEP